MSEAEAVAKIVEEKMRGEEVIIGIKAHGTDVPLFVRRQGGTVSLESVKKLIDEYASRPEFRKGFATIDQLESFIAHVNRFKLPESVVYANVHDPNNGPVLSAVYDYHPSEHAEPSTAGNLYHGANYTFPISKEWDAWRENDGKAMDQAAFAEFLEDRIADVRDPGDGMGNAATELLKVLGTTYATPAKLLELSRGLSVHNNSTVKNHVNLATGETLVSYQNAHVGDYGEQIKVPGAFLIAVPVFRSGERYEVAVRLRYRVRESKITWFYSLAMADEIIEHAIDEACSRVVKGTGLPLFYGVWEGRAR